MSVSSRAREREDKAPAHSEILFGTILFIARSVLFKLISTEACQVEAFRYEITRHRLELADGLG